MLIFGIIKVKVEYQGYIPQKMAVSEALVFHKHILFFSESLERDCVLKRVEGAPNVKMDGGRDCKKMQIFNWQVLNFAHATNYRKDFADLPVWWFRVKEMSLLTLILNNKML